MGSLRTRILATYLLVAIIPLVLSGLLALGLFLRYERSDALTRRGVLFLAAAADLSDAAGMTRAQLAADLLPRLRRQATALRGRFLVVDAEGAVLADTGLDGRLVGQKVRLPAAAILSEGATRPTWRRLRLPDGKPYYLTAIPLPQPAAGQAAGRYLVLAVAAEDLVQASLSVALAVSPAALLGLAAALVAAFFLSRSITRPLRALTRGMHEMAHGSYERPVPVQGDDELAELARSFNRMAHEVQRARQTERDLLANITHDLRTPLTSIQGFAQALLDGAVDDADSLRRAAGIIHEEAGRMGRLIDDLLELARLEANAGGLSLERLEPGPWLEGLAERFANRARAADLTFTYAPGGPLPALRADPRRLDQALANLIDNACKYTPAGGRVALAAWRVVVRRGQAEPQIAGRIVVGQAQPHDGAWLAISVADSGRGIAPEDVERVFERFYRADKARGAPGTGLGLAIVRQIIVAHGGLIAVASADGQGTVMTILLPAPEA